MQFRFGDTVIRHPFTGWDEEAPVFGDPVTVDGVGFELSGRQEPDEGLDEVVTSLARLHLPFGTPNSPHDEWEARGVRWRQVGPGMDWRAPRSGRPLNTEVHLEARTG